MKKTMLLMVSLCASCFCTETKGEDYITVFFFDTQPVNYISEACKIETPYDYLNVPNFFEIKKTGAVNETLRLNDSYYVSRYYFSEDSYTDAFGLQVTFSTYYGTPKLLVYGISNPSARYFIGDGIDIWEGYEPWEGRVWLFENQKTHPHCLEGVPGYPRYWSAAVGGSAIVYIESVGKPHDKCESLFLHACLQGRECINFREFCKIGYYDEELLFCVLNNWLESPCRLRAINECNYLLSFYCGEDVDIINFITFADNPEMWLCIIESWLDDPCERLAGM